MQKINRKFLVIGCLLGCFITILIWLHFVIPQPQKIRITTSNLDTITNASSTITNKSNDDGMFWVDFKTAPRLISLNKIYVKTRQCIVSLVTNHREISIPQDGSTVCNNNTGFVLNGIQDLLNTKTEWFFSGLRDHTHFGILLDVDWKELPLSIPLFLIIIIAALFVHACFRFESTKEQAYVIAISVFALMLRWWMVFIVSPPEGLVISDMAMYLQRGWEIENGIYHTSQLFQPPGFTLLSSWIRQLGGFHLFNWSQVLLSWGTVLLVYQIAKENMDRLVANFALLVAAIHIPLISLATLHYAENSYAFLITLGLLLLLRALSERTQILFFLTGAVLGIAFYFKGNHAYFLPIFCLWFFYQQRQHLKEAIRHIGFLCVGFFLICGLHLSWTYKNYNKAQLGPTAGALNFVEGKCPSKDNMDSTGARWISPMFIATGELTFKAWPRPFTDQGYFWKEGLKCIQQNPIVLFESLRHIYFLFGGNALWPVLDSPVAPYYTAWTDYLYLPFLLLGLMGILFMRRANQFSNVTALLVLSLFFTVWFFKSEYRFRAPFDGIFIVWCAMGCAWLVNTLKVFSSQAAKILTLWIRRIDL